MATGVHTATPPTHTPLALKDTADRVYVPPTDQQYSSRWNASNPLETTKEMKMVCFPSQASQYVWCPMDIEPIENAAHPHRDLPTLSS